MLKCSGMAPPAMRVVFITHNNIGLACMEELDRLGAEIVGALTRPQQPGISDQTDLTEFAETRGVPLYEIESANARKVREAIGGYDPALLFVVGWSELVSQEVLELPTTAALGMHPTPLPRGRGRAPIAWSLIKGLDRTVLSFFHLVEDNAASLYRKVVDAGRELIRTYYPEFESGCVPRTPQND